MFGFRCPACTAFPSKIFHYAAKWIGEGNPLFISGFGCFGAIGFHDSIKTKEVCAGVGGCVVFLYVGVGVGVGGWRRAID